MLENIALVLTTIATAFAAFAAWCSFEVSRRSLDFQKKYANNQNVLSEINRSIYKAETLQILIPKPLEMSDGEFNSIEPLLQELKSELERYNNRDIVDYQRLTISKINTVYELARDQESLNQVINSLENAKSKIFE